MAVATQLDLLSRRVGDSIDSLVEELRLLRGEQDRRTDKGPSVSVDAEPAEIDIETDTERQRQTAKDKQAERERPVRARKMAGRLSGSAVSASSER